MCKLGKTKMEEAFYVPNFVEPADEDFTQDNEMIADDEVILNCIVLHPERPKKKILQALVLGSVKLSEFRDMIHCRMDKIIFGEFSNNPDLVGGQESKEIYPSSFFYVESTFYNDTREPLHRDYSRIIMEWAKDSDRYNIPGLGLLNSKSMEETTFADLNIRLGYPYLFCHQGNCEHLVVFTDMRMKHENDPKLSSSYPFKVHDVLRRRKKCSICHIHLVKWTTLNDELAFEDPALFCEKCFRYLHYTKDGDKIASFEAYPYVEGE